jgi:beta-lactamase regulating signal transducer with metallopeptidase domain
MTTLTNWLSPNTMHNLGWTLLHFLWQGTAVAALAAVLINVCRRASARYVLGVGALGLMLAAPVFTFFFLAPSFTAAPPGSSSVAQTRPSAMGDIAARTSTGISRFSVSRDTLPWLVEAWLFGVAFFSLRFTGGFLLLERGRRQQSTTPSARVLAICLTLQRRLGLDRTIRYCECKWLQAPAVIGWFRPIVLLPLTALTGLSEAQLQSVIAHELAHIQRLDPFVNVFQISVETLLFYHPAVWWLSRRIRAEREHCCDDIAVSLCGNPVEYARALTLMEEWRSAPALAMAANRGSLSERIFRVLGLKSIGTGARGIGLTGGLLCLSAALIAGNALIAIAYPKPLVRPHETSLAQVSLATLRRMSAVAQQTSAAPVVAPAPSAKPSPARPIVEPQPAQSGSYIDGMRAAGLGTLTVDQLVAMKIQGVTPEYVRGLRDQGLHPDADNILSMRMQGVTPEYVKDLRGLDLNPDEDQIVSMRIQGVDAAYVRGMKEAGIQPSIDKLISLKIQGATPEYVRGFHQQGLQPTVDELVSMRIQGVTPEYVRDIKALGLKPTGDQFISMRIQGVTPEYIKALQAAGFTLSVDDIVSAKIQGLTPDFIERARKHGFQNLSLQKLIHLKQMGILEAPADI